MGCIYKITNIKNNMIYIGQTKNFKRRLKEYKYKSRNLNSRSKYKIMEVINAEGFDNFQFTILEDNIPDEILNDREIYWIDTLDSRNPLIGYNSKEGGIGGRMIDETISKMSNSSKSFKHSEEEKLKRSKPIFVVENNVMTPYISAKIYADSVGKDRSQISAAIKRGIKFDNKYIFYQNKDDRIKNVNRIINKKMKQNKVSKRHLNEYLSVYLLMFDDFDKESVETN